MPIAKCFTAKWRNERQEVREDRMFDYKSDVRNGAELNWFSQRVWRRYRSEWEWVFQTPRDLFCLQETRTLKTRGKRLNSHKELQVSFSDTRRLIRRSQVVMLHSSLFPFSLLPTANSVRWDREKRKERNRSPRCLHPSTSSSQTEANRRSSSRQHIRIEVRGNDLRSEITISTFRQTCKHRESCLDALTAVTAVQQFACILNVLGVCYDSYSRRNSPTISMHQTHNKKESRRHKQKQKQKQ